MNYIRNHFVIPSEAEESHVGVRIPLPKADAPTEPIGETAYMLSAARICGAQ